MEIPQGWATAAIVILALAAVIAPAAASSGAESIEGCRELIALTPMPSYMQGYCSGVVSSVLTFNVMKMPDGTAFYCRPKGSTTGQGVRILVKYLDEHPERLHLPLEVLAADAMRAAWPCQ